MKAAKSAFLFIPAPKAIKDIDERAEISKNTKRLKISLVRIMPFKLPTAKSQSEYALPLSSGCISERKIFLE